LNRLRNNIPGKSHSFGRHVLSYSLITQTYCFALVSWTPANSSGKANSVSTGNRSQTIW